LSRWQYPGQFFWQPVVVGGYYNVFPGQIGNVPLMDYFYLGSGSIFVESNGYATTNVALYSHVFYEGQVDRIPIRFNGTPYVITHGTGTNDGFHLGSFEVNNWTVDVGVPGSWIDAANNAVGMTAFNTIDRYGLLTYTTIVETGQALSSLLPLERANKACTGRWGTVRHFLAFFWLRVFPVPRQSPRPPTCQ